MRRSTKKLVKDLSWETRTNPYDILNLKFDDIHFQDRLLVIPIRHSTKTSTMETLLDVTVSPEMKTRLLDYVRDEGLGPRDTLFPVSRRKRTTLALELSSVQFDKA